MTRVNIKDTQTDLYIIFVDITFEQACKYLGKLKRIGAYVGAEPFGKTTKLKFEKAAFYYDEERQMLLKYKNK